MIALACVVLGAGAGVGQAALLAAEVRGRGGIAGRAVRALLVVGALLAAAELGSVLGGAAGWLAGFAIAGATAWRRLR